MFILRQITARLAAGARLTSVADAVTFPFRMNDVLRRFILKIEDGLWCADTVYLDASDAEALPLPAAYQPTERLHVMLRASLPVKVVVVNNLAVSSSFLIQAMKSTAEGVHPGVLTFQGKVASITVSVPAASDDVQVDYFAFQLPDLNDADSYRDGLQAVGVITQ